MHGQKRSEYKSRLLHPEASAKLATKAQQWNRLSRELLTQRRRLFGPPVADAGGTAAAGGDGAAVPPSPGILLALTEKMLSVNPDPSHLWNIRREMLLYALTVDVDGAGEADGAGEVPAKGLSLDVQAELALTAHCLQRNPKSYSSWYHRKWSLVYHLTRGASPPAPASGADEPLSAAEREVVTASMNAMPERLLPDMMQIIEKDDEFCKEKEGEAEIDLDIEKLGVATQRKLWEYIAASGHVYSLQRQHLDGTKSILQSELELCAQFLQMDERNFHCWNYRRFVVALLGSCGGRGASSAASEGDGAASSDAGLFNGSWSAWLEQSDVSMGAQLSQSAGTAVGILPASHRGPNVEESDIAQYISPLSKKELEAIVTNEWDFTTSKIHDNFSNGSAFHYRSKLLPLVLDTRASPAGASGEEGGDASPSAGDRYDAILSLAREEWENVLLNAIFTEPDDQTPWWYHRFIVSWAKPSYDLDEERIEEYVALLFEMAESLRELLEVEKEHDMSGEGGVRDESKGARCKWGCIGLHLVLSTLLESKSIDEDELAELREEAKDCLEQLLEIDPNRSERYQQLLAEVSV